MTQLEQARRGIITPEMKEAALYDDHVTAEFIAEGIKAGNIVIPHNVNRKFKTI